ncbi:MAG: M20/M25/M40 family metallo-hydrolase [Bryobacterales bacterium]|nr:M20/M25/M40 family metallo-hydrolase [Bryobacterales bacterium]MDE0296169.1 M20/M25/M40 family metallo-hydrolase [Bryobacterales bacterium]
MDVFALTRAFIDIESVTGNELAIGQYFHDYLKPLADKHGGQAERIEVEKDRYNVYAHWGRPEIVFSTHLDTVPPFIPSKEDGEFVWGRGACDTKGISASMIKASEALLEEGVRDFAMLFVVGEEVDGIGAHFANAHSPGPKYLINGEPTENKLALGSKGNLRIEIEANGKMAHSAYAELGDSAINKLLDNLERLRNLELPVDPVLGDSTCSIGLISGGRAANVIPDHASATAVVRVVSDMDEAIEQIDAVFDDRVAVSYPVRTPAIRMKSVSGFETTVVKYTTDIPKLTNWGQPLLLGPGTIHVAHTAEERVPKKQLVEAVELFRNLVKQLKTTN